MTRRALRFVDVSALLRWARPALLELTQLRRYTKRTILAVTDFVLLAVALWLAFSVRIGEIYIPPTWRLWLLFVAAPVLGVATLFRVGAYRVVTRYAGSGALLVPAAIGISALLWALLVLLAGVQEPYLNELQLRASQGTRVVPRSVFISYPILAILSLWGIRGAWAWLFQHVDGATVLPVDSPVRNVLIYGTGSSVVQLIDALRRVGGANPVALVDPSPGTWGQYVRGLKIYRPQRLASLVRQNDVHEVMLAMPRSSRSDLRAAMKYLEPLRVAVRTLPAMEDLAQGRVTVTDLRPLKVEDFVRPDRRPPSNAQLLAQDIAGKSVMVTGAGGIIGSELVRQALRQAPRRLVMFEQSETRLYDIEQEVEALSKANSASGEVDLPEIVAVLGSVGDARLVGDCLRRHDVATVYHAAFYNTPLFEHNAITGLENNVFGTAVLAQTAEYAGAERVILVSTYEAAVASSMMAASKRLAELVVEKRAIKPLPRTLFAIVRLGSVLHGASPLWVKLHHQIASGGPMTIADPQATRHFLSLTEAATLIIQAGAMATGGNIFAVDMGEPVKLQELARSMLRLSGEGVQGAGAPDKEIAIQYVGLADGEALHEQHFLGHDITTTEHPGILECHERSLASAELAAALEELRAAMQARDMPTIRAVLKKTLGAGFAPGVAVDACRAGG